jgi:hypothetical protein
MKYEERWEKLEELGSGGQGKVYRVLDKEKVNLDPEEIVSVFRIVDLTTFPFRGVDS